ncbi:MAG: zinc ABC transporter substrate-binding protein [Candidatus Moranbacteria bacterium]|nr:zinc ABC transporter substrate-binding protein [Candidatus Moranbacteria bacterium]
MKYFGVVVGVTCALVVGVVWYHKEKTDTQEASVDEKISVVATFYPLGEMARAIGGERAQVTVIVPPGSEPHEYEPTPKDILTAYRADIFLMNGGGLDPWAEKIRAELSAKGVSVIRMSDAVPFISGNAHEEEDEDEEEHEEDDREILDPHFWLDPVLFEKGTRRVYETFLSRDSVQSSFYEKNMAKYGKELLALDEAYRESLASCSLDTVVTSHNAFSYLAKRYGFQMLSVSGLSPEAEPSPKRLVDMARLVQEQGIKYIFFETLVSPEVAQTLAREVGAETLVFDPLEGLTEEDALLGRKYSSVMIENLAALQIALQCR